MIWSFSFAQQYTNYTTKDGLPTNLIYKITQDAKGFIWFLTDKGLVKYNGNTMKTFTTKNGLSTNDIWELLPTPDGKVWYISKSSKLGYIENDSVHAFENENKNEILNPVYSSQVNNKIILTSSNTSHLLEKGKWKLISKNTINNIDYQVFYYIEHSTISALEVTFNSLNMVYKDKKKKSIKNVHYIKKGMQVRGQINDSLFYWSGAKDYVILNLNTAKIYKRNFKDEIDIDKSQHTRINSINNQIQITGRGFVGFIDPNYHIKNTVYIPPNLDAHFAMIDKNESVWIASFNNGVYQLSKSKKQIKYSFEKEKILKTNTTNNKIIANIYKKGFYKYNSNKKIFEPFINEVDYIYNATYIDSLDLEFYTSKTKIFQKKLGKIKVFDNTTSLNFNNDVAKKLIFFDSYLYGSFSFGLNKINPYDLQIKKLYYQHGITDLLVHNNNFLIATNNGLKQFKNEIISDVVFKNTLFNKSILSMNKISDTQILINTDGFGSFLTNLEEIYQLKNSEYLIVNNAYVENTNLWLATNSGVLKYTKENNTYQFIKTITKANGLPSNQINDVIIANNDLIVSTNNGIAILPKNQESNSQLLDIYIEKAIYNNHILKKDFNSFKYQENNNINFTVSQINYSENNTNFLYNYKLEPIQNNWVPTETNQINFNDLEPNTYIFSIKADNFEKKIEFTILPLWYQTIIFKATLLLFFLILLVLTYKLNKKRIEKNANQKANQLQKLAENELYALRSQMNPHFVFNSLNSIQYYIANNEIEVSEKYLVKFSQLIRMFLSFSSEKNISLKEEIKLLSNYLEIETMRFGKGLQSEIYLDERLKLTTLIPSMLLQPIVENAVNHGVFHNNKKGTIKLAFNYIDKKTFKVLIEDDGVGFKRSKEIKLQSIKKHSSRSTQILTDRIELLNASKEWLITHKIIDLSNSDATKSGTKVILTLKKRL